jgi:hypothetical protein
MLHKAGKARWFPPFHDRVENLSNRAYQGVSIALKSMATAHQQVPEKKCCELLSARFSEW